MIIQAFYVVLVLSALAVIGVLIAGYVRVKKHMAKPPDQTTVFRKKEPE